MSRAPNFDEQAAAAEALLAAVARGETTPHSDPSEAAMSNVLNALKRCALVATEPLSQQHRLECMAHVVGYLGEFVGMGLRAMPPCLQAASMEMFARELSEASGVPFVQVHHVQPAQPQEKLH